MFAGLGATIKRVAGVELPVLRTGMGGVATQVNGVAKSFGEFFAKASTARDVGAIFDNTTHSVGFLGAALTDVVAVFMDVATVGSGFLPSLSQGLAGATGKLRDFVARARESGALAEWMQLAITRTEQLGHIVGNVGGVLVSIFRAAGTSGGDFLGTVEKITGELNRLLKTPTAQAGLSAFFRTITQTVDALLPGVKEFAVQFFAAVKAAADTGGLQKAGKAISDLLIAAGPLLPVLTKLAGETLGSLATSASNLAEPFHKIVDSVIGMVDAVGPLGPAVVGAVLAFKGLAGAGVVISALGVKMGALALRIGISEVAATRLAMAMRGVGVALPIVGALIVGAMVLYDQLKDKADDLAKSVQDGSMTLISAIEAETVVLERQDNTWKEFAKGAQDESAAIGAGIGELTGQTLAHADAVNRQKDAAHNVLAAWDAQIAAMPPLEAAQARVKRETEAHALAVKEFGDNSPQAIDAAGRLQKANEDLKTSQANAAEATKTHSERVLDLWRAELDIVDKDLAYRDAIDRVADAQDRAAQAVKEHGVNSREAQKAFRDVERANLDAAAAAGDKARADAEAAGASNAAELGAKAHKDELLRLAEKASGPVRQALLDAAGGIDVQKAASNTAELQTKLHKDELGKLADQATGPLKTALENAGKNFDTLGGKHADAKWKAQAQKDELLRLAQMADGPLRQSLTDMANQITNLPNKTVWITANGQMGIMTGFGAIGGPELVRMSHGGALGGVIKMGSWGLSGVGYDAGGILPGHTPGRDVHTFVSPTGGVLHLSGGEAVMRPEWTRAVGVDYVKKANEAAARGGPAGVGDLHLPGISRNDTGSFAQGGVILGGYQPFKDLPVAADIASSLQMAAKMDPLVVGRIKALVDYLTAAQGGGPGWEAALAWARTPAGQAVSMGRGRQPVLGLLGIHLGHRQRDAWAVPEPASRHDRVDAVAGVPPRARARVERRSSPSDHMAGTIGNVNVESASGRGVQVGGPAWGATNPYFKQHWHMLGPAGAGAVGNVAGGEVRAIVQRLAAQRGWGSDGQWDALAEIIRLESNWDPKAANKTSTARGLSRR